MAFTLPDPLTGYRLGDPNGLYPIFDATGSTISPGRWNTSTTPVIYASEHYSTAMLECLVHTNGFMPKQQHFIRITIPVGVSYEVLQSAHLPGWHNSDCLDAKAYGSAWISEKRSCLLLVPSVVAREEHNILINPAHPDFATISQSLATPIWWDSRLYT
jgi:RES domain-containing protein